MVAERHATFSYDPFSAENTADPYPAYQGMLADFPVYRSDERNFWALTRFEDVQSALRDWRRLSSAAGVRIDDLLELAGPSPLTMDPPRHSALRNLVRGPFSARELDAIAPLVRRNAEDLVDSFADLSEMDAVAQFAKLLPVAVICEFLGVPREDAPMLKGWADSMLETVPGETGATDAARSGAAILRSYWTERLDERRRGRSEDLLSTIANAAVDGELLPLDEQIGMCNLVFEAGNATTGTLIANALLAMDTHRDQRDWLMSHFDLLPQAVEEFVRFESPVQGLLRVTTEEVTIHDVPIPAGARLLLIVAAANRDPRIWPSPDTLDLSRPAIRNLAFGEGIHLCLGAPLARIEAPIAIRLFLERFPRYEVTALERFHDVSMRTLQSLKVRTNVD